MRVLAVCDSDSYVKWGAALVSRMPSAWECRLVVLATPAAPSGAQLAAALAGTPLEVAAPLELSAVVQDIVDDRPDVVLLSLRGPVIRVVIRAVVAAMPERPVFLSGLPGISIPATRKALTFRSQVDLLVLHSHREIRDFTGLAERMGLRQDFALATLPFLPAVRSAEHPSDRGDIVFAAQAIVPPSRDDRMALLGWLAETAVRHPGSRVVIKLRASVAEQQTHPEAHPYDEMLRELPAVPPNLVVAHGPMSEYLANARGLVTVSSTAAIEAAAGGVPALVLDDFGVTDRMINTVFEQSGLLGGRSDLLGARFHLPHQSWLDDNYFHDAAADDWVGRVEALAARRRGGELELRTAYASPVGGALRRAWDRKRALGRHDRSMIGWIVLAVGLPARSALLGWRSVRRRLRRPTEVGDRLPTPVA